MGKRNGYEVVYDPTDPHAGSDGMVYVHRIIMSKTLGRPLLRNDHVHHLDGDRANNSLDNLELLSAAEHARKHRPNTDQIVSCAVCGEETINEKYCSYPCAKFARRVVPRPNYNQLKQDLSRMSYCAVGRKYEVSDNTIRKWARGYSLI